MKIEYEINKFIFWGIFGTAWLLPQMIIYYLPEEFQILKPILLIFFGLLFIYTSLLDKILLKKKKK